MKRLILLAVLCTLPSQAEERRLWKWSVAALAAATVADAHSSYGMREFNPLLRNSGNRFDSRSVALKAGAVGLIVLGQKMFFPGRAGNRKRWAAINFSMAATTGAFAAHNYAIRYR